MNNTSKKISSVIPYKLGCIQLTAQISREAQIDHQGQPFEHSQINDLEVLIWGSHSETIQNSADLDLLLVSIPIGLCSGSEKRSCDKIAKRSLANRAAEYLNAPRFEWLQIHQESELLKAGAKREYFQKIQMIRNCRSELSNSSIEVLESNPELAFFTAQGSAMKFGKNSRKGIDERLKLIQSLPLFTNIDIETLIQNLVEKYPKSVLSSTALLDASILLWSADRFSKNEGTCWGDDTQLDPETQKSLLMWT